MNFEGIGRLPGKFHITLDPTVTPVVQSPRRCALAIREVKKELDNMTEMKVIESRNQLNGFLV